MLVPVQVVYLHGVGYEVGDAHTRVEARIRVLEYHAHAFAVRVVFFHLGDVAALKEHFSARRFVQADDGASERALAAAALADDAQRLAAHDFKVYAVYGVKVSAARLVILFQFNCLHNGDGSFIHAFLLQRDDTLSCVRPLRTPPARVRGTLPCSAGTWARTCSPGAGRLGRA